MSRHHLLFVKDGTDEEKIANIVVSLSQLDEALSLWLTNHFLKVNDTKKNEVDRVDFEKLILNRLTFRDKSEVVSKIIGDKSEIKKFKNKLFRVAEIRNLVAHNTGWLGIPQDIDGAYKEFDTLMTELEGFMDLVFQEFQSDMDYAYIRQYEE